MGLDQGRLGGEDPEVGGRQEQRRLLNRTVGTNIKVTLFDHYLDQKIKHTLVNEIFTEICKDSSFP